jgi:hypothetical protein
MARPDVRSAIAMISRAEDPVAEPRFMAMLGPESRRAGARVRAHQQVGHMDVIAYRRAIRSRVISPVDCYVRLDSPVNLQYSGDQMSFWLVLFAQLVFRIAAGRVDIP